MVLTSRFVGHDAFPESFGFLKKQGGETCAAGRTLDDTDRGGAKDAGFLLYQVDSLIDMRTSRWPVLVCRFQGACFSI
jgi:hypothetical protein